MLKLKCLALVVGLVLLQPAPEDAAKKEIEKFQGKWTMHALEVNGKQADIEQLRDTTVTVRGADYVVQIKEQKLTCVISVDPSKNPAEIDMDFTMPSGPIKIHKGIYKFEGDTFTICRGLNAEQNRPGQFGTWPDTNVFMVTWKRAQE